MSSYTYVYGMNETAAGLLAVFGGFLIILLLIGIAAYILFALGLSRIARLRGMDNAFLAWIPVANSYLLGKVADDIHRYQGKQTNYRTAMLVLSIVSFAGGFIPVLGTIAAFGCSIALVVVQAIALYAIYKDYSPDNAVIMLVTSIIFSISWIFLFVIRNKRPITLGGGYPGQGGYPGGPGGGYNGYGYNGYPGSQGGVPGGYPPPASPSYVPSQAPQQTPAAPQQPAAPPQQPSQPEEINHEGENPHE